ncbi:MAG: LysR family transcriptional regulator [Bacteriovoracaceae bacterium]|nr:LysR family transcriptional regulator [Bacteriovoracaceae bacterium]
MIRLNDIYNFIEVSSFSSLSLAAKKMEVTQPALSESVARLEKDLGVKLFYRTKNGISLTPQGRKILDQAKQVYEIIHHLGAGEAEVGPTVILGCHTTIGSYFLPTFFSKIQKKVPTYKIQLKHNLSRNIQLEIQAGRIDVGVVVNAISNPDLIIRKIAEDKVCVWKSKKKNPQKQIITDLNLFQSQSVLKKWAQAPKQLLSTESLELVVRLTNEGCGYGIIPKRTVDLLGVDLIQEPNTPVYSDQFSIVHRPEFGKTRYEKEILATISQAFNK